MKPLDLQSEPYSPLGSISASGISRILGTPQHDRLQILVRETVQNIWDARDPVNGPLSCTFRLRVLRPSEVEAFGEQVLAHQPEAAPPGLGAGASELRVLEIIDHGTSGLGGPLQPDRLPLHDEPSDFVDFVRNVGSLRDKAHGGGTYGYGKSSLYALSSCRSICVHTLGKHYGEPEERFIACRLGRPFSVRGKKHTGRHWWGRRNKDGVVDPCIDKEASALAEMLGLPERRDGQFGTSIMVLLPDLEHRSPAQAVDAIRETLVWNFWPKLLENDTGSPAMAFTVELDGVSFDLPRPDSFGPLSHCASAMRALRDGSGNGVIPIECHKPKKRLGSLAIHRDPVMPRPELDTGDEPQIPERSSHVALMRPAELVVKYVVGPQLPSDLFEYAGVFICDDDVEAAFAKAEPPAHDDWIPDNLTGREKTFVRVALRRINEALRQQVETGPGRTEEESESVSLGGLADSLGGLLMGQPGERVLPGGEGHSGVRGGGGGGRRRRVRVARPVASGFRMLEGVPCALFRVGLSGDGETEVGLSGTARVLLDGGASTDQPADAEAPIVLGWYCDGDTTLIDSGDRVSLAPGRNDAVVAAVRLPRDCAVTFSVQVTRED